MLHASKRSPLMFFGIGETKIAKWSTAICTCCAVLTCAASFCCAQTTQDTRRLPDGSNTRASKHREHPARTRSATVPEHLAGKPGLKQPDLQSPSEITARRATVSLNNGRLTVDANNSDLTQILRDLADISGMTIKGLTKGPRIFGVYGPGNSRDVLTDLLAGSGYNYIMVGGAAGGPPRELLLVSRENNPPMSSPANQRPAAQLQLDESEQPDLEMAPSVPSPLGPGAITPAPSPDDQDDNTRVQHNLQRLQQIQDDQQKNAPK